jgi:hypothetical protein
MNIIYDISINSIQHEFLIFNLAIAVNWITVFHVPSYDK